MIFKVLLALLIFWLFFQLFGKRILLYLLVKLIKRLEAQTLKDMQNFESLYDEQGKKSYYVEEYKVIVPAREHKPKRSAVIEEVAFEEVHPDE